MGLIRVRGRCTLHVFPEIKDFDIERKLATLSGITQTGLHKQQKNLATAHSSTVLGKQRGYVELRNFILKQRLSIFSPAYLQSIEDIVSSSEYNDVKSWQETLAKCHSLLNVIPLNT